MKRHIIKLKYTDCIHITLRVCPNLARNDWCNITSDANVSQKAIYIADMFIFKNF